MTGGQRAIRGFTRVGMLLGGLLSPYPVLYFVMNNQPVWSVVGFLGSVVAGAVLGAIIGWAVAGFMRDAE